MGNNAILNKLLIAFNNMTDKDLQQLLTIIANPDSEIAFKKIIEGILFLRKTEKTNVSANNILSVNSLSKKDINRNILTKKELKKYKSNNIIYHLMTILNDKSLFPKTIDLIESVNAAFQFDLKYEEFYKRGRRDLIQRYKKLITSLPKNEQKNMISSFLRSIKDRQGNDAYQELFEILIGNGNNS